MVLRTAIRRGVFRSVTRLIEGIQRFLDGMERHVPSVRMGEDHRSDPGQHPPKPISGLMH
jgi:hypothetical protein